MTTHYGSLILTFLLFLTKFKLSISSQFMQPLSSFISSHVYTFRLPPFLYRMQLTNINDKQVIIANFEIDILQFAQLTPPGARSSQ